jgi:protoheme IX farnesyltransferase
MSERPVMSRRPSSIATAIAARLADYATLSKARLSTLVLAATATGYLLGGGTDAVGMLHVLVGTALVAFGASALNQVYERDADARMNRTRNRPLPAGRVSLDEAVYFGVGCAIVGAVYLLLATNPLASALASATLLLYVFAYTPLKRISPLNLAVGAVPGAMPPLIGFAAATGTLTYYAFLPALIVFFWQYPHFLAISWLYREDYARGGFAMLAVRDPDGRMVGRQMTSRAIMLAIVSLLPVATGMAGPFYAVAALVLNAVFLSFTGMAAARRTDAAARRLFIASLVYLPVLFALLVLDPYKA